MNTCNEKFINALLLNNKYKYCNSKYKYFQVKILISIYYLNTTNKDLEDGANGQTNYSHGDKLLRVFNTTIALHGYLLYTLN